MSAMSSFGIKTGNVTGTTSQEMWTVKLETSSLGEFLEETIPELPSNLALLTRPKWKEIVGPGLWTHKQAKCMAMWCLATVDRHT